MKKNILFFQLLNLALFFSSKTGDLDLAIENKDESQAKQILKDDRTANPNSISKYSTGWLLLDRTIHMSWPEGTLLLLEGGANPNIFNKQGECPLHLASRYGNADIVSHLLHHQADVNVKSVTGRTPLHNAAFNKYIPMWNTLLHNKRTVAQILLKYGASIDVTDNARETVLDITRKEKHKEMFHLISDVRKKRTYRCFKMMKRKLTDEESDHPLCQLSDDLLDYIAEQGEDRW